MIDKKNTFLLKYLVDFVQFLPWTNCVIVAHLKIVLSQTKI